MIDKIRDKIDDHEYKKRIHDPKNVGKHVLHPKAARMLSNAPTYGMDEIEKACEK